MQNSGKFLEGVFLERYCGICNKLIIPSPHWMYKIHKPGKGTKYYCSYTCYRKAGGDSGQYEYYVRGNKPTN